MKETMDHTEVRELLEDAAIEPGGLERLMAGDTPTASIVAGHLAGCADCAEELERLRRSVGLIRPTVRAVPPPELKERTLAYVAALGRPRGAAAGAAPAPQSVVPPRVAPATAPTTAPTPIAAGSGDRRPVSRLGLFASVAAAVIVAVTGTALLVSANQASTSKALFAEVEALGDVARWTLRVDAQQDVRRVELASVTGTPTSGSLVFSPSSKELVVVAEDLTPAAAGHEYRCWVEVGGKRSSIGKMFFGGELAYWVGDVELLAGLPSDARFGVSLVDLGAPGAPGESVLASS
jgi:hypothetical protein